MSSKPSVRMAFKQRSIYINKVCQFKKDFCKKPTYHRFK